MALDELRIRDKNTPHGPFRFVEIQNHEAAHASWWSFEDEQIVRDRWWKPTDDDTVLDIGAAFGSYALPALKAGARVICFSPARFDTDLLQRNLSLNPDLQRRCLVLREGLYSAEGFFDPDHCRFVATREERGDDEEKRWLRVRTLDAVLRDRPGVDHIRWMKLDVEGAELEVLKGARLTIEQDRPNILVENHEFQIPGIGEQVKAHLLGLGLGYECQGPVQHGAVSHSFFSVKR